ncbi:putative bifunctional diguanylate cyclase/phosphodiesterase [Methylobacterium sp. J-067]|uniref:putative bifunctional diguanylate cyclase/phosphodiesterase n=1 Tax=Methylobacterium sp. J-067 TaxID=2836648 RepID=UPI001FBB3046|nr:EAL domain-containing protein [Methylobacterium sp. J-067]MCJ2024162.1 EAL domain-containing protein [Methylobacterium sp. J-067]
MPAPQPLRVVATNPSVEADPVRRLATYFDGLDQGVIAIDRRGRVVVATAPARAILSGLGFTATTGSSGRDLLRILAAITGSGLRDGFAMLRRARAEEGPQAFETVTAGRTIALRIHPVDGGWTVALEDMTEIRAREANSAELARIDPLTGLANRLMLRERLSASLDRLNRYGEPCAVLLLDLDRFKPINDTLGHAVGDALLEKVADRLRSAVRSADTVARIGGDEFVVIQAGAARQEDVTILARRLVDLIGRTYIIDGQLLTIGVSVGAALAPKDGADAERLLKHADLALYRAKLDGRATFRFFEPEMDVRMQARRRLELDIRQALARREFVLHYQPQLNLKNQSVTGCEALLRWKHPERGTVSPADFIPLAEEVGLIVPIGEWVVRQACRDAALWPDTVSVAVNVSPAQFKSERLVDMIVSALATSGLPPRRLEVEITEGVLLQNNDHTLDTLHRLRKLGVRVSMDDFGTGYSSLSYLRSFPFDKIKIDRSFVKDIATAPDGDAIIRAIAGLGRSLGMTTVAEGVETEEQMRRIQAEGCTDVQGYLISRPVPLDDLMRLLPRDPHANPSAPGVHP